MTEDNPDQIDSEEEIEKAYGESEVQYSVEVNGKRYELNEEAREAIQTRAEHEYEENSWFSAFWKVASPDQYAEGDWEDTIHDAGDPVLVIETEGFMVPWEKLDKLDVEMQEVGEDSQFDGAGSDDIDNGNGLKMVPPDDDDDVEKQIGRTHFDITPRDYEEVPSPDGEDPEKIPPMPQEMGDEPVMVAWIPDHPEVDHTWSAGKAIAPMHNRIEWNVQKKADQPRPTADKDDSHDHWESLLKSHDCEKLAELGPSQDVPSGQNSDQSSKQEEEPEPLDGKYGGNNWQV